MKKPEKMTFDIVIVGAGPAGLSAAIRLAQLSQANDLSLSICLLEKAASIGGHVLSGAVIEARALDELIPEWRTLKSPIKTAVTDDAFTLLTKRRQFKLPTPSQMNNHGNYIVSLGQVCRWLAEYAENLGVSIFTGFSGASLVIDEKKRVCGVMTGPFGFDQNGNPTDRAEPGVEISAKYTLVAEGCRGTLSEKLMDIYSLRQQVHPQTYALGVKEVWTIPAAQHHPGKVMHTIGWPLKQNTYGGSFIYHLDDNKVAVGLVVGLDYANPYLDPFQELQRFKTHPSIREIFAGGERIAYGARALNEGGWQSIPELSFPGGAIMGCAAGFLNVPKIKGTHTAMKSGMITAETVFEALQQTDDGLMSSLTQRVKSSWVGEELKRERNLRPGFRYGLLAGVANAALETYFFRGKSPWTLKNFADHTRTQPAKKYQPIHYAKADGILTFDKLSSLPFANVAHREDQPCHLVVKDSGASVAINYQQYAGLEARYCPAAVYEYIEVEQQMALQINASNCIHCKTCDIKDPLQNIKWNLPEGGGGPNYEAM